MKPQAEERVILAIALILALAYWACAMADADAGRYSDAGMNVVMCLINLTVVSVFMRFVLFTRYRLQ